MAKDEIEQAIQEIKSRTDLSPAEKAEMILALGLAAPLALKQMKAKGHTPREGADADRASDYRRDDGRDAEYEDVNFMDDDS